MSLGPSDVYENLSRHLEENFGNSVTFDYDSLSIIYHPQLDVCSMYFRAKTVGRLNVGRPTIRIKSIHQIVNPILETYGISSSGNAATIHYPNNLKLDPILKADTDEELLESLKNLTHVIQQEAIPFWEKHSNLAVVSKLADQLDDVTTYFRDEVDFNIITALSLTNADSYQDTKQSFMQNQVELANYSEEFKNYPLAFQALIGKLDSM